MKNYLNTLLNTSVALIASTLILLQVASAGLVTPPVTVTSVDPTIGTLTGGTVVKIVGSGFTGATAVNFGSTAATSYTIINDTTIEAVTPARSAGAVSVEVVTLNGANTPNMLYTYATTSTFTYTNAQQTYTVPPGVTSVRIQCLGAQGATPGAVADTGTAGTGGLGGKAVGDLAVTPGQILYLNVGGQANGNIGGFNGGGSGGAAGGGGASDVRSTPAVIDRVIVAGGGGGGGNAGALAGGSSAGVNGGNGGGLNGSNGVTSPSGGGGFGATGVTGGLKGIGCAGFSGEDGGNAVGEIGGSASNVGQGCCSAGVPTGGSGGGGYVGGGAGGGGSAGTTVCLGNDKGGGGGGAAGSNFTLPAMTNASSSYSANAGDGLIVISVLSANTAPTVIAPGITDQSMLVGNTRSISLTNFFADVDLDTLTFSVTTNTASDKATAIINGNSLDLTALANGVTDITIKADDGKMGLVSDTFQIAVGTVNPSALQMATTGTLDGQNGLYNLTVNVTNSTPRAINGFRLHVDFASYLTLHPSLRLYNSTSQPNSSDVYVDYPYPLAGDAVVPVKLTFYISSRNFPTPFTPILTVEALATSAVSGTNNSGVQPRIVTLAEGKVMLEFDSVPGQWYRIRYSHNLTDWFDSPVPVQASNNRMQWIDCGAPITMSPPSSVSSRYYLVDRINSTPE